MCAVLFKLPIPYSGGIVLTVNLRGLIPPTQVDPLKRWSGYHTSGDHHGGGVGQDKARDVSAGLGSAYHRLRVLAALNVHHQYCTLSSSTVAPGTAPDGGGVCVNSG